MPTAKRKRLSERRIESLLVNVFSRLQDTRPDVDARTFEHAMVLTQNRGIVVRDGKREFQITIVQSR